MDMVQSHMYSRSLKNYLRQSKKKGVYSFRRGIPEKLRPYFYKDDGKLRGREWKEPLKTKSRNRALILAANINQQFEHTKSLAELEFKSLNQPQNERDKVQRFLKYLKKQGIHPDYAPSILAPEHVRKAWIKKQESLIYELEDAKTEFIDQVGEEAHGDHVKYFPQPMYYQIQEQIDFIKGKSTSIKSKLKSTLSSAYEEYIHDKVHDGRTEPDAETKSKLKRTKRIASDFASFIGSEDEEVGWHTFLTDITREEAKNYFADHLYRLNRAGSTVGREITVLSAIYNHAVTEHKQDEPTLSKESNPFAKLRSLAENKHQEDLRLGIRQVSAARAWTPKEYALFKDRIPQMNIELQIIALISLHTGARLKDTTGLMLDDLVLDNENNSYIDYRHNKNRKITKDSIERKVPIYGEIFKSLQTYKSDQIKPGQQSLFPSYCESRGSDSASNLLNQKHLNIINKEKTFKVHGLRKTLMAKFDAALVPNSVSGYLIGWRNSTTVGMQMAYKSGYPHLDMLKFIKQGHAIKEWAIRR